MFLIMYITQPVHSRGPMRSLPLDLAIKESSRPRPTLYRASTLLVTAGGQGLLKLVHMSTPPPVLTSGDHRQITYDWQPSRTHPTGMPSCHLIQIMQMMKNSVGRI